MTRLKIPAVFRVVLRGYLVIAMLFFLWHFRLIDNLGLVIFSITVVSISMLFGVGYLLLNSSSPVRSGNVDIPNTVLIFVKGALVMYFISLLGTFSIVSLEITGLLMTLVAFGLALFGTVSYVLEIFARTTPVKRPRLVRKRIRAPQR